MAYSDPALNTSVSVYVANPFPVDAKYGPYTSISNPTQVGDVFHADSPIFNPATRHKGLVIGFLSGGSITEYWFKSGTTDAD